LAEIQGRLAARPDAKLEALLLEEKLSLKRLIASL
jgi:hypothetical protein